MAQVELIMPKMGESVAEATIIKWLKNEGDTGRINYAKNGRKCCRGHNN